MRAYYNEHDPYAAQWLRNLIAFGCIADGDVDERSIEDVATSGRVLLAGSASDQAMNGMSGTESTPSSARCNSSSCATPQASGAQVCAQRQARGARRTTRMRGGRLGWFDRSDADFRPGDASLSSLPGMRPLPGASANGIRGLTSRCLLDGTRPNKATCCAGHVLSGTKFRTDGSYARRQPFRQGSPSGTRPCKSQNSTSGASATQAFRRRTERTSGEFPCL